MMMKVNTIVIVYFNRTIISFYSMILITMMMMMQGENRGILNLLDIFELFYFNFNLFEVAIIFNFILKLLEYKCNLKKLLENLNHI